MHLESGGYREAVEVTGSRRAPFERVISRGTNRRNQGVAEAGPVGSWGICKSGGYLWGRPLILGHSRKQEVDNFGQNCHFCGFGQNSDPVALTIGVSDVATARVSDPIYD